MRWIVFEGMAKPTPLLLPDSLLYRAISINADGPILMIDCEVHE